MFKRMLFLVVILALVGTSLGCSAPAIFQPVSASDTVRISIIDDALRRSGDENAVESEDTEIYVAHTSMGEFESWLRASEIETAARLEGRSAEAVGAEWERAGIKSVPLPILEDNPDIWVVFLRGIQHDPGPLFSTDPRDWDPDADPDIDVQPFVYDNYYTLYDEQGYLLNSGALVDSLDKTPPGVRVPLDQIYDDPYVIERVLEAQPTPAELQRLPTATPLVAPAN